MTTAEIATRHGGTPTHCQHSPVTICTRCPIPLHVVGDRTMAYQFPNALSAVQFARDNYNAIRAHAH